MTGVRAQSRWAGEPAPVCVAVGGRAGAQVQGLIDTLTPLLADCGPVVLGALPPSNRPGEIDRAPGRPGGVGGAAPEPSTAASGLPPGTGGAGDSGPPIDVLVQLLHGAPQASDLRMLGGHRRRGAVVIAAAVTAVRTPERAPALQTLPGGEDASTAGRLAVTVRCDAQGRIDRDGGGISALVAGLRAAIGVLLAARADRMLAAGTREADYGADRAAAERALRGAPARQLREIGRPCWDDSAGDWRRAVALAAWYRGAAARHADPVLRQRAEDWTHRYIDRALALGAPVHGRGGGR